MTNIFNKTVLVKNGTLVGNWYEEEVLRNKTGVGRTIPGKHIPKRGMDLEKEIEGKTIKDNTFKRIIGERIDIPFKTNNSIYGEHSKGIPEDKFKNKGIKEKIFEDFFKGFITTEINNNIKNDELKKNIRIYDTTNKNILINQPPEYNNIGKRHMLTQDNISINNDNIDKLFMATHDMSKYPNIISNNKLKDNNNNDNPYYKDKEYTYWLMNLDKSNMYRSHINSDNPFLKSSAFTQTIHNTKGVKQYNGNITNKIGNKNIILNDNDELFINKYKVDMLNKGLLIDLLPDIKNKILSICINKGWLGIRILRLFLRNLSKRTSNVIDKVNFKFYFNNFGINFTEKEVEFIYLKYDQNRNNHIYFQQFIDDITIINDNRLLLINKFYEQVKNISNSNISFKKLENLICPDYHPEVK